MTQATKVVNQPSTKETDHEQRNVFSEHCTAYHPVLCTGSGGDRNRNLPRLAWFALGVLSLIVGVDAGTDFIFEQFFL